MTRERARKGTALDDVVFHLLHRAAQRADEIFAKETGDVELTARQFAVLIAVAEDSDPSQTSIVRATGIDRSTAAEMIGRMARDGLLHRRRSREDARSYVLQLTDAGRQALNSARRNARRTDAALLARLSSDQHDAFLEALKTIGTE